MTLRPNKTTQKILISTTSRLVGEYEKDGLLITHAWPNFYNRNNLARIGEGPLSRSAYIFVFETDPIGDNTIRIPDYSPMGNIICSYLSVLYGKRFDNHGLIENSGSFQVPELTQFNYFCDHLLPQNSHTPRVDLEIPLNLVEFSRIEALLLNDSLDNKFRRTFQSAGKFYLQALQNAENDPEVAYLNLITAGEILSNFYDYDKEKLLDDKIKNILSIIEEDLQNGTKIANVVRGRLLQIKRRFIETICNLIDKDFFNRSESSEPSMSFQSDTFRDSVAAAYDLRSQYVHTGISFGDWVSQRNGGVNNEIPIGRPVLENKDLNKILAKAPTYIGLERVIRYCLIQFAQHNIAK